MRSICGWLFVGLVGCTNVNTAQNSGGPPPEPAPIAAVPEPTPAVPEPTPVEPEPTPVVAEPTAPATAAKVTVQMTAATLADDCGGPAPASKAKRDMAMPARESRAKRACEQSSMQLSVVAAAGAAATQIAVKKVELFDDAGALIGELTARTPTIWDQSGAYRAWDQRVAPGQDLSVSYALSEPPWGSVPGRRGRNYVLKAVLVVADGEQAVQREVHVDAPTILPPGVKT